MESDQRWTCGIPWVVIPQFPMLKSLQYLNSLKRTLKDTMSINVLIYIASDSQAALKALMGPKVTARLVLK